MVELQWDEFEWDNEKYKTNHNKHGVSFDLAADIFLDFVFCQEDTRRDYGEPRYIAYGIVWDQILVVVFTPRPGRVCRIISARKASRHERTRYTKALGRHRATH